MPSPLQTAPTAFGTNDATSLLLTDPIGALSPVIFELLLADLFSAPERANVELEELAVAAHPSAESAKPEKRILPAQRPQRDNSETGTLSTSLCQMPATLPLHSILKFGPDLVAPAATTAPTARLRTLTPLHSCPDAPGFSSVEPSSGPDATTLYPNAGGSTRPAMAPPVVLEGSMCDNLLKCADSATVSPVPDASPAIHSQPKDPLAAKSEVHIPSGKPPAFPLPSDREERTPDQDELETSRKPLSSPSTGVDRPGSPAVTSPSTTSQSSPVQLRPHNAVWPASGSPSPGRAAPVDPIGDLESARPTAQTRSLTVRLQQSPGRPVDMRFVESRGTVTVTVRSNDTQLARAIASDLPTLERGLESKGWSSELRVPQQLHEGSLSEQVSAHEPERLDRDVPLASGQFEHSGQDSARRQSRTNWADEIEDRATADALRRLSFQGEQA
jgi:hypothetical protein